MNVLFICTTGQSSYNLEEYFKNLYQEHDFKSGGILTHQCKKFGKHRIIQEDIDWANLIVYFEEKHKERVEFRHELPLSSFYQGKVIHHSIVLNASTTNVLKKEFLKKVKRKLKKYL